MAQQPTWADPAGARGYRIRRSFFAFRPMGMDDLFIACLTLSVPEIFTGP